MTIGTIVTGLNYRTRKPNLRANIEIYSFLALEELFQFLDIKRCLIAIALVALES